MYRKYLLLQYFNILTLLGIKLKSEREGVMRI